MEKNTWMEMVLVGMFEVLMILGSLLFSLIIGPIYIKMLKRRQFGQFIREDGPQNHLSKQGTPTMGGTIFLLPILIGALISLDLSEKSTWLFVGTIILFGFIGGIDDYFKVAKKQNEGLTSKQKIVLQFSFSLLLYLMFIHNGVTTMISMPFIGQEVDFGLLYPLFVIFLFIGVSNATNLTDGLDGLLTGNAIVSFATLALIAFMQGNESVLVVTLIIVASLVGFLVYNFNPAKIFMGDMGSLVLGALMVTIAIQLKVEVFLLLIGFVYLMETLSVIIQVISYKTRKKRVFKMSPIHHHFELSGMKEKGIFSLFVGIQVIMSVVAILLIA